MSWFIIKQQLWDVLWLIFLVIMLWHFWKERHFLKQTKYWLVTKGHIDQLKWGRENTHLWPQIEYSYQVFDKQFTNDYLFLDTSHNNPNSKYARRVAYRAAVAYEQQEEIDVFYNPNHPQQAALDITIPRKLNLIIVLLVCLLLLHLMVVFGRLL